MNAFSRRADAPWCAFLRLRLRTRAIFNAGGTSVSLLPWTPLKFVGLDYPNRPLLLAGAALGLAAGLLVHHHGAEEADQCS